MTKTGKIDLHTTHPHIAKMLKNQQEGYEYSFGCEYKTDWICPFCNEVVLNKSICYVVKSGKISCPSCSDNISLPNKMMYRILRCLKSDFITEFKPEWCIFDYKNRKRFGLYDFYLKLNNVNYLIEMDGHFHYRNNYFSGQTLEDSTYIDFKKDELANKNNFEIIRIDCKSTEFDYVKESILKSKLFKILDFSNINWDDIFKDTIRPIVYDICDVYNLNEQIISSEIAKKFGFTKQTIIKYLKQGNKIGLCNYNTSKQYLKVAYKKCIPVICLNTNKIYDSAIEASNDTGAHSSRIIECCKGIRIFCGKDKITKEKLKWSFC